MASILSFGKYHWWLVTSSLQFFKPCHPSISSPSELHTHQCHKQTVCYFFFSRRILENPEWKQSQTKEAYIYVCRTQSSGWARHSSLYEWGAYHISIPFSVVCKHITTESNCSIFLQALVGNQEYHTDCITSWFGKMNGGPIFKTFPREKNIFSDSYIHTKCAKIPAIISEQRSL